MLTEAPFSERAGALEEDSSLNNLDLGKLSVSLVQEASYYTEVHESTSRMVTADVSDANALISAFNSFNVVESSKEGDDVANITAFASQGEDVSLQTIDQIEDTDILRSFDFASVAEPCTQRDCEAEVPNKIEEICKDNQALIVHTSSRRSSRGSKSNQKLQSVKPSRSHRKAPRKTPLVDFDSLLISRRRRSLVTKRPRTFGLGPTGNIFPDSGSTHVVPNTGNRKKTSRKSSSKGKRGTAKKSLGKSCASTGPICLKIRFGNRYVMPNIHESSDASVKIVNEEVLLPCGTNFVKVTRSDVSTRDTNLDINGVVDSSSANVSKDCIQANMLAEGCNLTSNTENRFSDPGTSPDSEVINSVPHSEAFEKGLPDALDSSITLSMPLPFGNVAGISSPLARREKKKDKHLPPGVCSLESKLTDKRTTCNANEFRLLETGQKACGGELLSREPLNLRISVPGTQSTSKDAEICHSSDPVAVSISSHSVAGSPLVYHNIGQVFTKSSKVKAGTKNRSEILNSRSKKNKASGKRGNKGNSLGKIQVAEKDEALVHGAEALLMTEGESSKVSSGLMVDGSTNQCAPPKKAWVLCDECKKWRRISAALADQIEKTNCGWTCRENSDRDFADCAIPQEKSDSDINKELEISDEEDARENIRKSEKNQSKVDQPPTWSNIRSNFFLHRSRKTQPIDEVMVCHCKPPQDGRMGCGAKCLNRMLNIECVRGTCPCGELCSNQQFQKRKYAKLKWFRCGKKGFGLRAVKDISAGNFIIEYVGEVLDVKNYEARQRDYALKGHRHFYFMTLNGSEVIDACSKGNLGRFINHSCDPNCRTEKWMVNGEVCVGLFAIKDIKKGEEVTFDYNYVRVFGAAVKKCVCGSSNCRGYIGGDPKNSEVIIQDDDSDEEFSEPAVVSKDNDTRSDQSNILSDSLPNSENNTSDQPSEIRFGEEKLVDAVSQSESILGSITEKSDVIADRLVHPEVEALHCISDESPDAIGQLTVSEDFEDSLFGSVVAASKTGSHVPFHKHSTMQVEDKSESRMNKAVSSSEHEYTPTQKCTETVPLSCKLEVDVVESKRKLKDDASGRTMDLQKANSVARTHHTASVKNGKINKTKKVVSFNENVDMIKSILSPHKSRKLPDLTLSSHAETVEEKLNQLLDSEGGISKRTDASRGYLKLLILTAASGNTGDGESIQSTRDLSMILDALLKTKSRTVLVDIINKNGLQMLHNIIKRYRKEFNRTPILRKLLKILEYLAQKEILTAAHITGGPRCPGVESFKDSILTLTEHNDKQVHQIARSFRDTWIRKFLRRNFHTETDEHHHHAATSAYSQRLPPPSTSYDHQHSSRDLKKPSESSHISRNHSPASAPTSTARTRKRKSRWDTPADEITSNSTPLARGNADMDDEDAPPPGFSTPCNKVVPSSSSGNNGERNNALLPPGVISGESHRRFTSRAPVSYGFPSWVVEQFGILKGEDPVIWTMSPGLPFHPFPPLPPHPKNSPLHGTAEKVRGGTVEECGGRCRSGQKRPFACSGGVDEAETRGGYDESHERGQKHFKQQKWSGNSNNAKLPPWLRVRSGWGNA